MEITNKHIRLCARKYAEVRNRRPHEDPLGFLGVKEFFDFNNVQGFFMEHNRILYIMIMGTNEAKDWIFNLLAGKSETPYEGTNTNIRVHSGFFYSYMNIRWMIQNKVYNTLFDKILVFGHSLGGAIATLTALDIQHNFPKKDIGLLTFGSPRVGNAAFKKSIEKRIPNIVRCVNGNDVVPCVPFKKWGFEHVGELLQLGKRRCLPLSIKDHMSTSYMETTKGDLIS